MTRLTVALSGDCIVTRGSLITSDPRAQRLRDVVRGADFAVTNLELVPYGGRGHPIRNAAGGGCLISDPDVLDEIVAAGFTVFGCANNHALDLGPYGLLRTMELLAARRIPFAGIGADLDAARRPVYVDRPQGSLALISCSSTMLPGQEAAAASPGLPGRPGLNPLRHQATSWITPAQMEALRDVDAATGLRARRAETRRLLGVDPALLGGDRLALFGHRFQMADEPGYTTGCHGPDLEEISRWVAEGRRRADLVVVSVHSHEPGPVPEEPAEFLREFAHRMIDEGADVVVGHGPHFLRGIELYHGKPIFYSLGNVASQIELAERISAEDYAQVAADRPLTPARYFDELSDHGRRLFATHQRYWRSLVPVLTFDGGRLVAARLHPIELGFSRPVHRRGRPWLADPDEAREIVACAALLSEPFGTTITEGDGAQGDDAVGEVVIAPARGAGAYADGTARTGAAELAGGG